MPIQKKDEIEVLPGYKGPDQIQGSGLDACIVLHGYGRVARNEVHFIDNYEFVGGIGRNIPKKVAEAWKKGTRLDGSPAISRVFPQAILPSTATEADFASAVGEPPMDPARLAALITSTDANLLVTALGRMKATEVAQGLLDGLNKLPKGE